MIKENKEFIILKNKNQASEYLMNFKKFEGFTPIVFNLEAEALLLENKKEFKTEEEFERHILCKDIEKLSIKTIEKICEEIDIKHREINLFQLFYQEFTTFLINLIRNLRILKEINKLGIKKIIIFENINQDSDLDVYSKIAKEIFKDNLKIIKYKSNLINKNNNVGKISEIADSIQNFISKIKVSLLKKTDNKIFFCGNKNTFEHIIKRFPKKKNKIIKCNDVLQKSLFINKRYIPFYKFSGLKTKYQEELIKNIKNFKRETNNLQFLDNLNLEKELVPILRGQIYYYLNVKFLKISEVINEMLNLIKKKKIDLIMLYADVNPFEKTFAQVGKMFNIPSIVIQHGIIGSKRGFLPKSADYILVFGEESKKQLIKWGYPKNSIIITGSPQFDKYANIKIEKKQKNKIVFIMDTIDFNCPLSYWKKVYKILFKTLKKFPEYKLIIKWRDDKTLLRLPKLIGNEVGFYNYSILKDNLFKKVCPVKLFADSDIVILTGSTMVFDAFLSKKPVISIYIKRINVPKDFGGHTPIKIIHNQKSLEKAINKSKKQTKKDFPEIKKYLKKELFKLDGKASDRVVDFINKLINKENIYSN